MPQALLQPFVPGEPMSASFLVSREGRAWLIAIGRQRMELRDGRFEYRGGEIPVICPDAADQVSRAVAAIDGLAGFVGVDFIWDAQRRRATILEINPRPTTSLVGPLPALARGPSGPGMARGMRAAAERRAARIAFRLCKCSRSRCLRCGG